MPALLAAAALLLSCARLSGAADIYVSPAGSDGGDGSQARPFASLPRAQSTEASVSLTRAHRLRRAAAADACCSPIT